MKWGNHWSTTASDKTVHGYIAEAEELHYIDAQQVATIKHSTPVNQQGMGYIRVNGIITGVVFTSNNQEDLTLIESNGGWEHTAAARQLKVGMDVFVVPNGPVFKKEGENAFGVRFVLKELAFAEKSKQAATEKTIEQIIVEPTRKERQPRPYQYMVSHIFHCVNDDMPKSHLGRIGGLADKYDGLLERGESLESKTAEVTRREHMVPLKMVGEEASEMVRRHAPKADVTQFIAEYVGIVIVSKAEQELLDIELGWKTTMPPGWKWGMNPYQRFKEAGIRLN